MSTEKKNIVSKDRTISFLEEIIRKPVTASFTVDSLKGFSSEEANVVLPILLALGVITVDSEDCSLLFLPSETAILFIKSLIEIIKQESVIVPVWDDNSPVSAEINETNALNATNLLYLIEKKRVEGVKPSEIRPIKTGILVRAVIKRKIWGKEYVLMQYDSKIRQYQLIGGIKHSGDSNNIAALKRKLNVELPELLVKDQTNIEYKLIYETQKSEQEIIPSMKFGVYAKYKTFLYHIVFSTPLEKAILQQIEKNKNNRWISFDEIKHGKSSDKKDVFHLPPLAIEALEKMPVNVVQPGFTASYLLERTWVQVLLAISTIASVILALLSLF